MNEKRFSFTKIRKIYLPWLRGKYQNARQFLRDAFAPPSSEMLKKMALEDSEIDLELPENDMVLRGNRIFLLISAFFIIAFLWAAFSELDELVRAEATVIPPSSVQIVQSRLEGAVMEINVKLGDRIEKESVMYRLEDTDVQASFNDNEVAHASARAAIARLRTEANGEDKIDFPQDLQTVNPELIKAEEELFKQRQQALQDKLVLIDREIREKQAEMKVSEAMIENLQEEVKILEPLVKEGHESRLTLLETKNQLAQHEGQRTLASLSVERSRDEYESLISEFRAKAAQELSEANIQAGQAGARETALRGRVKNAAITAPVSGTVSAVHIKTLGAVVQPGTAMAEIVPDENILLVRARVPAEDIANIYIDQQARVALSAYDVSRFGTLDGHIQRIATNTTQEENAPPYYETIIEVPDPKFSKSAAEIEIVPGMTASVNIVGRKRSVLSYILTPLERASMVVFREN